MDSMKEIIPKVQPEMKTSSHFYDPTAERKPCPHGSMCRVNDEGELMLWECAECRDEKEAKEQRVIAKQERSKNYATTMRDVDGYKTPKRFAEKTLDNYQATSKEQRRVLDFCQKYLVNFESVSSAGVSIVFCGKPGTGKTHLSYAIANSLRKKMCTAVVKTAADMTAKVKSAYKSSDMHNSPESVVATFSSLDLLIIDEVGVQIDSEAERRILFDIMNKRYENMKPTVMISNLAVEELTAFVGERVMDRMNEGGGMIFAFTWGSYR